ncbi:MAG: DNA polymerase II large subunit [Candidatus Undinarchaeales archaeon]
MEQKEYLKTLEDGVNKEYNIASDARKQGVDPAKEPEIYIAKDLADKVEGLIEFKGLADIVRKLQEEVNTEEEVAFKLVDEVIKRIDDREEAADLAVRAALAFLTQGAVAAPLEGIAKIKILKNPDNSEYLAIYYAGPIRAAGGTAEAISVVVADYVHKALGLDRYKPNQKEIGRYAEEIRWYHRRKRLQYRPKEEEVKTIIKNVPVCVDGDPTEPYEVSTYRNLGRVKTNRVRGGMCLVVAEGLAQKAPKLLKRLKPIQEKYGLDWSWLEGLLVKRKTDESKKEKEKISNIFEKEIPEEFKKEYKDHLFSIDEITEIVQETSAIDVLENYTDEEPEKKGSDKFLNEIPAGRPVFSYPGRKGGFNLRYGRTRGSGYAALCLNPATMHLLDDFIAIGTQIRLELPGKAGIVTPCDTINGPTILLKDGELLQVDSLEEAKKYKGRIERFTNLGDILISAGDFFENNHKLLPPAYCEEWWAKEVKKAQKDKKASAKEILNSSDYLNDPFKKPDFEKAKEFSDKFEVPLHPVFTFHWNYIRNSDLLELAEALKEAEVADNKIILENKSSIKKILEKLCVFHKLKDSKIVISKHKEPLLFSFGRPKEWKIIIQTIEQNKRHKALDTINKLAEVTIKDKAPTRIGARMGRPEKAKPRKMTPAPHVLFPTGAKQGRVRDFMKLYKEKKKAKPYLAKFKCDKCSSFQFFPQCPNCGEETKLLNFCPRCRIFSRKDTCEKCNAKTVTYEQQEIDINELLDSAAEKLGRKLPDSIKGILGMSTKNKIPEAIEKGILRAEQDLYVFKDGTIRHDSTDAPLTHFKPFEIHTSIEKLKKLGYNKDIYGKKLENEDQILELKPQDILISDYGENSATSYLLKTSKFVDNLLESYYGLEKYYNYENKKDLAGTFVIALAPHTSTGIVGRIIGSTDAKVTFAHPCFHDAKRRDCDGDEDAVMLLLDALLNFSKSFLPQKRGGKMDAPLVITSKLGALEIDDEVYDIDIVGEYPLSFYETVENTADPNDVNLLTFGDTIYGEDPFAGWNYTHETTDINNAPLSNIYTKGKMSEKLKKQMHLAEMIDAVDEKNVAEKIIDSHFLPDIKGNLRTFSKQKVRCTKCNSKYRRPPLSGVCTNCGGNLTFTVHRGSIEKYLQISKDLIKKYNVSPYISQQIALYESNILSIFGEKSQKKLQSFT